MLDEAPLVLAMLGSMRGRLGPTALNEATLLALGAAGGQLVVLALSPMLTRLFTPSDLGVLGVFSALVAVLSVILPLGYDQAILGAHRRSEAMSFVAAALAASVVLSACSLPIVWFAFLQAGSGLASWWLAPLAVLGTLLAICTTTAQAWYIRQRAIATVSLGTFTNMSGRTLVQVACGFLGIGVPGLIGGEVVGRIMALAVLDRKAIVPRALRHAVRNLRSVWRKMKQGRLFALFQMPSSALDIVLVWMPLPLVAYTYGPEWAGIVTLVQRIGTAPASLIGQSLVQIYHQRAAYYIRVDRPALLRLTLTVFSGAAIAFLPLWALLWMVGPPAFGFVFGANWADAGTVAAIWAPLVLLQIFAQVASRLLILLNRQVVRLIANTAQIILMPAVMLTASQMNLELPAALQAAVVGSSVIYLLFIGTALWHCRR